MNRKLLAVIVAALALLAAGCEKKLATVPQPSVSQAGLTQVSGRFVGSDASPQQFIAEHDEIVIVTPESELQKSWESAVSFCGTIQCEVVSSRIIVRTAESVPSGSLSVRVAPQDLNKLVDQLQTLGKIVQHTTDRQDETSSVVDSEARIKNLAAFRDNLRAMLSRPSVSVSNLIEIQRQLADTQSQLDSETAQRKILANQTEKIAVDITFRVEGSGSSEGGFAEIWDALRQAGSVLGDSTASVITFIVAAIPWLILILLAIWILTKAWRRRKIRGA